MTSSRGLAAGGVVLAVLGVGLAGCSVDTSRHDLPLSLADLTEAEAETAQPTAFASPFLFTDLDGRVVDVTLEGDREPSWFSEDHPVGPMVVMAPGGAPPILRPMTVVNARSLGAGDVSYDMGNIADAIGYETQEVAGRSVISGVVDGAEGGGFNEIVVERGPDLAVDYRSPMLDVSELIALDRATSVDPDPRIHRHRPPDVPIPDGWITVGQASPHLVAAMSVCCEPTWPTGVYGAHVEDARGRGPTLTVTTVPSVGSDVLAALGFLRLHGGGRAEAFLLDGRPAVFLTFGERYTMVVTTTEWGDLLVVRGMRGMGRDPELNVTREELVAVAQSVERID